MCVVKRLSIAAVGLALVVGIGGLLLGGCGGHDGQLREYARQMQGYFNGFNLTPERDDVEKIGVIEPPRELALPHERLKVAATMVMLAEEHARGLEASEQARYDQEAGAEGGDRVGCASVMEYDPGMSHWASAALKEACALRDLAHDAYVDARFAWSVALSKACGGPGWAVVPQPAMEACLK
jgi:hypothetical protein